MQSRRAKIAQEILDRRDARQDLLKFCEYTHPSWETGEHHRIISDALMRVERGECKRLMIEAPPRHTKSEMCSKRFPAWWMGRNPTSQIICASNNGELATDFSAEVRDIIGDQYYKNLFDTTLRQDAKAAGRWRTEQGGIYYAVGVDGAINGRGAHAFLGDDLTKGRNEAESPRMREVGWRWFMGDAMQRLMPGGAVVLMGTRWHEDDIMGRAYKVDNWEVVTLPAIKNEDTDHEEALWPGKDNQWWPLEELHKKKAMYVKAGRLRDWKCQYQQNPTPEEGTHFLRSWFSERYLPEILPEAMNVYIAGDFAVTEQKGGNDPDFTELGVFGVVGPDVYVLDWWHGRTTPDVWIDELLRLAKKWNPVCFFGEGGVIRRSVEPFLVKRMREKKTFFRCEWPTSTKDKLARATALRGMGAAGCIHFPENEMWAERVVNQIVGFGSLRFDDAFDTIATMCRMIHEAHPALILEDKPQRPRDRYRAYGKAEATGWRTA